MTSTSTTSSVLPTIRIDSGFTGTLTYFTGSVFQCIDGQPVGNAVAVNPLLLGFTEQEWKDYWMGTNNTSSIPWCGKTLTVIANGKTFVGTIIDTCDPVGNPFIDPVTGQTGGGKCGYDDAIDLYGDAGKAFINSVNGDNFYHGDLIWSIS
jgi:hypothetical protein